MDTVPEDMLDAFVEASRQAAARGLVRCSSGNLSRRLDETRFLATASRSWMANLTRAHVCLCRTADGTLLQGPRPTVEVGFHAGILRTRADVHVVMHFQSPCATALACRPADNVRYDVIPEIPFYIGPVARVPYLLPGSPELAEAVTAAMQDHDMVIMSHHGLVTAAVDYAHALQNAEFFELACDIITRNREPTAPLSETDVDRLLALRRDAKRQV